MWYIIVVGYLFVTILFSAAQPSIPRALIYFVFWSVLPSLFTFWAVKIWRRNRRMKRHEQQINRNKAG
ncbi:hypothetical protein [Neisseria zalophi]|uniref:Uncharacterized protein n=1 Tax=Neisseria zalophi TaxID=640030 RepID=A0A5J6PX52_9NEIS|nr:hypothetical protein [Neisseria zalophi]QEY25427.1 hypothetical protein D0T92_01975 [Neisseria zalophi]